LTYGVGLCKSEGGEDRKDSEGLHEGNGGEGRKERERAGAVKERLRWLVYKNMNDAVERRCEGAVKGAEGDEGMGMGREGEKKK
jgi:hypothetical protein